MAGETILQIETNEKLIQQFDEPFRKVGYHLIVTQWGEEALTIIQQEQVDAIIMRSKLPGMSCVQFLQNLRRNPAHKNRPIVIVYGKDELDAKIQAFKTGADDFMVLPFSMPELFFRIDTRLKKTLPDLIQESVPITESMPVYLEVPAAFPPNGSLVSRSLPFIMGNIFQRSITGILRLIEGKAFRVFYFENGLIRGTRTSGRFECLPWRLARWGFIPGEHKKSFKTLRQMKSDTEILDIASKYDDTNRLQLNNIVARYIESVLVKAFKMVKSEYDWIENDTPKDMVIHELPGINPLHVFLSAIRSYVFKPSFKLHMPKAALYLVKSPKLIQFEDSFRLLYAEKSFIDWAVGGRHVSEVMELGPRMLPYSEQLIHALVCFDALRTSDQKPPQRKEPERASISESRKAANEPVIAHDSEEMKAVKLEDFADDESKPSSPKTLEPAGEKAPPTLVAPEPVPVNLPPPPAIKLKTPVQEHKATEKTSPPARSVRELYPDRQDKEETTPEPLGLKGLGFGENRLMQGNLPETPFVFLFAILIEFKKTGVLTVTHRSFETNLYWRRGKLIFTRTDDPKLRIDQVMFDMGMITPQQRNKVNDMISEMGKMRSGTIIFKQQIVNMLQLSDALHEQMKLILNDLFNLTEGNYKFNAGVLPEEDHIPLDLPTEMILLEGCRKIQKSEVLASYLPDLSTVLTQTNKVKAQFGQLKLGPVVTGVLDKFRHTAALKEAFAGAELPLKEFKLVIFGLVLLGLLGQPGKSE